MTTSLHGNRPAIILFEVMCVVLLVSIIALFVFKGMSRSLKAIRKSQAYFTNFDKLNAKYWNAFTVASDTTSFNMTVCSMDDGKGVKFDVISSIPTKAEEDNEDS